MVKIVLIDESYPLNTRNTKILASLEMYFPKAEIHILTWDRSCCFDGGTSTWSYHLYNKTAVYGNKLQKLVGMFGYRGFCHDSINSLHPDVIIVSHWNNLLMLPKVDYKKQMVIYENLDAPTGPWLGRKVLNSIERYYIRRIALTVHASRFYTEIYPKCFKQLVLENKPTIETSPSGYSPTDKLRVVYLGNIRYIDILKNLVDAVRGNENLQLAFHGDGPDYNTLCEYSSDLPNVRCTGAYKYKDIGEFYHNADVIWAAYPNRDFNVKYAISNKFHESMAYGIPAIYAEKTKLAEYAVREGIGFEVDPYSSLGIRTLLDKLVKDRESLKAVHLSLSIHKSEKTTWDQDVLQLVNEIKNYLKLI